MPNSHETSQVERRQFLERAALGAGFLVAGGTLMASEHEAATGRELLSADADVVKPTYLDAEKVEQAKKIAPRLAAARTQDLASQVVKNLEQYKDRVVDPKLMQQVDETIRILRLGSRDMVACW